MWLHKMWNSVKQIIKLKDQQSNGNKNFQQIGSQQIWLKVHILSL